jgi:hypothetical protein
MAVALQIERRTDADDAGADDGDVAGKLVHWDSVICDQTVRR